MNVAECPDDPVTNRRHVAVVAPSLDILGGQGVQAAALISALKLEGFTVSFVPVNPRFAHGLGWLRAVPYMRTILNQFVYRWSLRQLRHVDIVHLFSASYWSFVLAQIPAINAAQRYGKPVVLNYHSGEAEDHLRNWGRWVHPAIKRVKKIVVPSLYLNQVFARYGYQAQIIPNIIDISQFTFRLRDPLKPTFLSVRNLENIYRIENTLAAFALIKTHLPLATLLVAGYGRDEQRLKQYVVDKKIADVTFVGRIEPAGIADVYNQADIFINSSVVDNQPLSILEAMAAGLPVISTSPGDIPQMIRHKHTGMLVPEDDPAAVADAAIWLLNHQSDVNDMVQAARVSVQKYTWMIVKADWNTVLSESV